MSSNTSALADRNLAFSVARHKSIFFSENDARGQRIDYETALAELADDYARMLADRMLLDEGERFDALMERCTAIEARANAPYMRGT